MITKQTYSIKAQVILDNGFNEGFTLNGKRYKANFNTWALLDYLTWFNNSTGLKRNENGFAWVDYSTIMAENPLLSFSAKYEVSRHMRILEFFKIIKIEYDREHRLYFAFDENYELFELNRRRKSISSDSKPHQTPQNIEETSQKPQQTPKAKENKSSNIENSIKIADKIFDECAFEERPPVKKESWLDFIKNKAELLRKKRKELKESLIKTHFNELRILEDLSIEPEERLKTCIENDYLGLLFDKERQKWREQGSSFCKMVNYNFVEDSTPKRVDNKYLSKIKNIAVEV